MTERKKDSPRGLLAHRIGVIRAELEKRTQDYHFANGYRAGLDFAVLALDGRDIRGNSIDPPKKPKKGAA